MPRPKRSNAATQPSCNGFACLYGGRGARMINARLTIPLELNPGANGIFQSFR
jgi:hypothetical protein